MKAAVYSEIKKIHIKEVPRPGCEQGEILIKVYFCAICGTDVRIYLHGHKKVAPPHIIGHEIAGEIADIGEGVKGYRRGEHVTVSPPSAAEGVNYVSRATITSVPMARPSATNIPEGLRNTFRYPGRR